MHPPLTHHEPKPEDVPHGGRQFDTLDRWVGWADRGLRTLSGGHQARRPMPTPASLSGWSSTGQPPQAAQAKPSDGESALEPPDRRLSGRLMRVNHVGEVCAQALYDAQALTARDPAVRRAMRQAAEEEIDHLAWTEQRLGELGARRSWLNPIWYAGAFGIGWAAGRLGDRTSLGFVVETERQVEAHLASHLQRLPADDEASRAIVEQMKRDEARHADMAMAAGAARLPLPVRGLMRAAAAVMTRTAHWI